MSTASYETSKRPGETATGEARTQYQEAVHGAVGRMEGAASAVADQGRQAAENIREVTDTFANAIEESLEKRPMTTLAMAVGVGFFLGALWQR